MIKRQYLTQILWYMGQGGARLSPDALSVLGTAFVLLEMATAAECDLKVVLGQMAALGSQSGVLQVNFETDVSGSLPILAEAGRALVEMLDILLGNIIQHAGAAQAELFLETDENVARLMVMDNGRGFLAAEAMEAHPQGGLQNLQAIAGRMGGSVRIYSRPGSGTRVHLMFPLSRISVVKQKVKGRQTPTGGALLINDSTIFMEGLANLLNAHSYPVLGSISDGQQVLEAALRLKPGAILLDTQLKGQETFELARSLKASLPDVRIAFLTDSTRQVHLQEAIRCGASAYLHRNTPISELMAALRGLGSDQVTISPVFASRMVMEQVSERAGLDRLTPIQLRIYELVQQRLTNKDIAERLNLSEGGVKYHLKQILLNLSASKKGDLLKNS